MELEQDTELEEVYREMLESGFREHDMVLGRTVLEYITDMKLDALREEMDYFVSYCLEFGVNLSRIQGSLSCIDLRRHFFHRAACGRAGIVCVILAAAVFLAESTEFSVRRHLGSRQHRRFKPGIPGKIQKFVVLHMLFPLFINSSCRTTFPRRLPVPSRWGWPAIWR